MKLKYKIIEYFIFILIRNVILNEWRVNINSDDVKNNKKIFSIFVFYFNVVLIVILNFRLVYFRWLLNIKYDLLVNLNRLDYCLMMINYFKIIDKKVL